VTSGFNPISAAGGFLAPVRKTLPRSSTARPSIFSEQGKEAGRRTKFAGGSRAVDFPGTRSLGFSPTIGGRCIPPFKRDPVSGDCKLFLGDQPGPDSGPLQIGAGLPVGEAVMGRYGAALMPGSKIIDRAVCLPGMVLGDDDKCYNRGQLKNSERMWPRGRRPLLTGGDMRAIGIAARAGARLERTTKRLQKIGMMKKPAPRRKMITSGPTDHHHHD